MFLSFGFDNFHMFSFLFSSCFFPNLPLLIFQSCPTPWKPSKPRGKRNGKKTMKQPRFLNLVVWNLNWQTSLGPNQRNWGKWKSSKIKKTSSAEILRGLNPELGNQQKFRQIKNRRYSLPVYRPFTNTYMLRRVARVAVANHSVCGLTKGNQQPLVHGLFAGNEHSALDKGCNRCGVPWVLVCH